MPGGDASEIAGSMTRTRARQVGATESFGLRRVDARSAARWDPCTAAKWCLDERCECRTPGASSTSSGWSSTGNPEGRSVSGNGSSRFGEQLPRFDDLSGSLVRLTAPLWAQPHAAMWISGLSSTRHEVWSGPCWFRRHLRRHRRGSGDPFGGARRRRSGHLASVRALAKRSPPRDRTRRHRASDHVDDAALGWFVRHQRRCGLRDGAGRFVQRRSSRYGLPVRPRTGRTWSVSAGRRRSSPSPAIEPAGDGNPIAVVPNAVSEPSSDFATSAAPFGRPAAISGISSMRTGDGSRCGSVRKVGHSHLVAPPPQPRLHVPGLRKGVVASGSDRWEPKKWTTLAHYGRWSARCGSECSRGYAQTGRQRQPTWPGAQ